ncbi:hypothetical protein MtrunA17_Chr1g0195531 [Medicago truncatula]|uniref:Uncharacterized protein n=1 Tax=Medicago truncatula TaxID=3880 RepID=A0A396JYK5_MEDTR|nr:hypothetical protein MtrunA17_Chr1g0195531 [Medicago truncatula]
MNRRSRTSKMIDLINFKKKRLNDVVSNKLKSRITKMMHNVLFSTGEEIINNNHTIPSRHQPIH